METPAELDLPDDVEALKALLLAQHAETRQLRAEIAERRVESKRAAEAVQVW